MTLIELEFGRGIRLRISGSADPGLLAAVIPIPSDVRVSIATGHTDMPRGMNGLALHAQQALKRDPHAGDLFVFRGRRANLVKVLWRACRSRQAARARRVHLALATDGVVVITPAQLAYMLEGIRLEISAADVAARKSCGLIATIAGLQVQRLVILIIGDERR